NCQAIHFPPREVCPACRRASVGKMTMVNLSGRGTVLESTRIHKPAPGFELQVPYFVALVQTEEGPVVTGQIVDSDEDAIVGGARVKAVFRRLGQDGEAGVIYYGTKWQVDGAAPRPRAKDDGKPAKKKRLLGRRAKE
ncbi:MAG: uncharacterized protein QOC71_640, partial [Thermoplasmata archaeon]|nr:uncharacterized protein [Thermoplasmata archaeon]